MARTVSVEINGTSYNMPASYAASRRVAEEVGDPLQMAMSDGQNSPDKWTSEDVISIIHIGVSEAGCGLPRDKVAEAIFEKGVIAYMSIAAGYVTSMISGESDGAGSGQKKAKSR